MLYLSFDPGTRRMLAPQIKQVLLRIAQEAISNAMRHGQPTIINVSVRSNSSNLVLEISDNGSGMPSSRAGTGSGESLNKKEGFGLTNMLTRPKVLVQRWIFNPLQVMGPASSSAYQSVSLAFL